jgi:hypothetical protein
VVGIFDVCLQTVVEGGVEAFGGDLVAAEEENELVLEGSVDYWGEDAEDEGVVVGEG